VNASLLPTLRASYDFGALCSYQIATNAGPSLDATLMVKDQKLAAKRGEVGPSISTLSSMRRIGTLSNSTLP
jgi:hypothetical protein